MKRSNDEAKKLTSQMFVEYLVPPYYFRGLFLLFWFSSVIYSLFFFCDMFQSLSISTIMVINGQISI